MTPLREGFTTGACAAACALASCLWQRDGECPGRVEIAVPEGRVYTPEIHALGPCRCAVFKDSGDDPDITNGAEVWAEVCVSPEDGEIVFAAGEGVGKVTLPGLKLPVGEAAINPVPRRMITEAVRSVFAHNAARVTVGITGGRETAKKTFNPRLGIEGGLSILGTTGVVRPMSEEALTDTIRLEMNMRRANGARTLGLVFGSQGETALKKLRPGLDCVQISNFVGFALDTACELGFERVLLAGQPGKLAKVAGGCMQTHSKYGDGRREPVTAHLALLGAPSVLLKAVMESVTLDGVIPLIQASGCGEVWTRLCRAASGYCRARTKGALLVDTMMLDGQGCPLGEYKE
ncbi:MAG: cobalamin biosynthesis protein CbiD [Clostridia bacterium]|nr:cobalamin biosynthesis protein CbiD [Clostridia bacterium]